MRICGNQQCLNIATKRGAANLTIVAAFLARIRLTYYNYTHYGFYNLNPFAVGSAFDAMIPAGITATESATDKGLTCKQNVSRIIVYILTHTRLRTLQQQKKVSIN